MAECNLCTQEKRLSKIEDDVREIMIQNARTETSYSNILTSLSEIKGDIQAIKEKPGKRWDTIISSIITAIVAFIIGYLLR